MEAPVTVDPSWTSTGTDSPVSMDSSTAENPSTTLPSVAIFSPGRTTKTSPIASWEIGMRVSEPSTSKEASLAPIFNKVRKASDDCPLALTSK